MTYNIYVYNLIGWEMAVSKEILDLIPEGCKVNWNEKQQRFYGSSAQNVGDMI